MVLLPLMRRLPGAAERGLGACRAVAEDGGQGECAARLVGGPPQPAVDGGIRLVLPGIVPNLLAILIGYALP